MRGVLFLLVLLPLRPLRLAAQADSTAPAAPAAAPAIFRYISVAPYGVIRLGEPFNQASILGEEMGPRLFRLRTPHGRQFRPGDTEAVLIELDQGELVQAMYFAYVPAKGFEATVKSYATSLGPPARAEQDSAGLHLRRATWADRVTLFELTESVGGEGRRLVAVLRERARGRPT
ncbi:MAG: hypothetical protein IPK12_01135 [Gemmatimonadetes bacterium]|nr:hypothetical protein [Gemmatimonadota bacterium]